MNSYLKISFFVALNLCSIALTHAQEYAPVLSKTPIIEQLTNGGSRLVGYQVSYEYQGKRFNAEVPNDPGDQILIQNNIVHNKPVVINNTSHLNRASVTLIENQAPPVIYMNTRSSPQYIYYPRYYNSIAPVQIEVVPGLRGHHHHHRY